MKFITHIVAFSAAFIFSVLLIGAPGGNFVFELQGNQTQRAINVLLRKDVGNGLHRDYKIQIINDGNPFSEAASSFEQYAEVISEYVSESETISDDNLPPDFRAAWQTHMLTWREHANFLNQTASVKGKITSEETYQIYKAQDREITKTWLEVLQIARSYGAVIPEGAY